MAGSPLLLHIRSVFKICTLNTMNFTKIQRPHKKKIQINENKFYLLKKVSLSRWCLCHLPTWWQRYIIRDLKGRLAEMLRRWSSGSSHYSRGCKCPRRNSTQLQRCWWGMSSDMLRGQGSCCPCISAGLSGMKVFPVRFLYFSRNTSIRRHFTLSESFRRNSKVSHFPCSAHFAVVAVQ